MDTCSKCGQSILFGCEDGTVYTMCGCGESLPEVDEVAELEAKLEECHSFFAAIGTLAESTLDLDGIRDWAAELLTKHRGH